MKATDLLKKQHTKVDGLFTRFEKAKKAPEKAAIFEELAANLVAHDAIEREIFYPACEEEMGMTELLGEALVEHGLVEFMIYRADQNLNNDTLAHHVKVRKEVVEHHVDLLLDERRRHRVDPVHALGVLRGQRGDGRHRKPGQSGYRLDVRLDARPAAGIRPGDDENAPPHTTPWADSVTAWPMTRQTSSTTSSTSASSSAAPRAEPPAIAAHSSSGKDRAWKREGRRATQATGSEQAKCRLQRWRTCRMYPRR